MRGVAVVILLSSTVVGDDVLVLEDVGNVRSGVVEVAVLFDEEVEDELLGGDDVVGVAVLVKGVEVDVVEELVVPKDCLPSQSHNILPTCRRNSILRHGGSGGCRRRRASGTG